MLLKNGVKIVAMLVVAVLFASCTSSDDIPEEPSAEVSSSSSDNIVSFSSSSRGSSSSSSSSLAGNVNCLLSIGCAEVPQEACTELGGTVVPSCQVSSSSRALSSSSLVASSSSSQPSSSSSNPNPVSCDGNDYYTVPGCPGYIGPAPSSSSSPSSSSQPLSSSSNPNPVSCTGNDYYTVPGCPGYVGPAPSSSSRTVVTGSFTDPRDEQSYVTVTIGSQTWMAGNLNYKTINGGSICYSDLDSYCATYGRLYDWDAAMVACPTGWHLPSDAEWSTLENSVGGSSTAGKNLKAMSGWYNNGNGQDTYGFAALPGGNGDSGGYFYDVGYYGNWWSSTEYGSGSAYLRRMYYSSEYVSRGINVKFNVFSVRCAQD